MPKTLLGRCLYYFVGGAAGTTLMLCGLEAAGYVHDQIHKKEKEVLNDSEEE